MLLNVIAHRKLNWRTPTEVCCRYTPDISSFLHYDFYEPVYYYDERSAKAKYPVPKEKLGRWCGPTEHCGPDMISWILTDDTPSLVARSVTRSAVARAESAQVNLRAILDSPVQTRSELFDPSALEGSDEPFSLLKDNIIDSYLLDEDVTFYELKMMRMSLIRNISLVSVKRCQRQKEWLFVSNWIQVMSLNTPL